VAALNAARASHGLQPISGWVVSSQAQNCALISNAPCGTNEASTGVSGVNGAEAVSSWMSTSSANILLEPGTGPAGSGLYQFVAEIGWAYEAATAANGGGYGYVAVIGVCADSPNFIANCP